MLENVDGSDFNERGRTLIDIALYDGKVLIRKDFLGDRTSFVQEWFISCLLYGRANVPAIHHVDEKRTVLYKAFIPGRTLRDVLVDAGAQILSVQTDKDPSLLHLTQGQRIWAVLARGTRLLPACFPPEFIDELETQIRAIHACGVTRLSLTFGNVMIDGEGRPWLIDFEGAQHFDNKYSPRFFLQRRIDRRKFSRIYNRAAWHRQ